MDAPLLADFVRTRPSDELLELGTGSGVISILLSIKPFARITALEVQERLADLARRNVALNGLDDRIEIVRADFRAWDPGRRFDVVFSNPPYIRGRRGRLAADEEKSVAKHEIMGDIFDIMRATRAFLKADGRAYFVYPGKRRKDFEDAVSAQDFGIGALRPVLSREGEEASLFLAMCGPALRGRTGPPSARPLRPGREIHFRSGGHLLGKDGGMSIVANLKRVWNYRVLIQNLVSRELKARYRGTVLGFLWSFFNPLLLMIVYTVVFGFIIQPRDPAFEGSPWLYALFLFCGVLPWTWFSSTLLESANVLMINGNLIKKILFPAEILPVVTVTSNLINFLFGLPILLVFIPILGKSLHPLRPLPARRHPRPVRLHPRVSASSSPR